MANNDTASSATTVAALADKLSTAAYKHGILTATIELARDPAVTYAMVGTYNRLVSDIAKIKRELIAATRHTAAPPDAPDAVREQAIALLARAVSDMSYKAPEQLPAGRDGLARYLLAYIEHKGWTLTAPDPTPNPVVAEHATTDATAPDAVREVLERVHHKWHYVSPDLRKGMKSSDYGYGWNEEAWQRHGRGSTEVEEYIAALAAAGFTIAEPGHVAVDRGDLEKSATILFAHIIGQEVRLDGIALSAVRSSVELRITELRELYGRINTALSAGADQDAGGGV